VSVWALEGHQGAHLSNHDADNALSPIGSLRPFMFWISYGSDATCRNLKYRTAPRFTTLASANAYLKMTTTSVLFSLPDELLLHIMVHVDNANIVRVRLVCRRLEKLAIEEFRRRFLSHLLVLHDKRSVAKLQTIARQERLNRYVRNITISGRLSEGEMRNQSERCINWHQDHASAIQGFPNLELFTIDNILSHGEEVCSCIFSVAIKVFQSLGLSTEPRLNLAISADDASPYTHLFDPRAQSWKDFSALKVSSLTLVTREEGDNTWEADLLYSLRNLQHCNIEGNVPYPTWAELSWPMLNTMELKNLYLPNIDFVAFIVRHSTTLSSIALANVTVREGTWEEPLQKVAGMKQLRHVHLIELYQMDPSAEAPDSLKPNFPEVEPEVVLNDSDDISIAAEVFRHHFRTATSTDDSTYLVDLRLVKAAVEGEIGYEQGHWQL
jgi:hypothetical protein